MITTCNTLSEETAHPTVYLRQLSANIQVNGLSRFGEGSGVQKKLAQIIFCSPHWMSPGSTVLIQLTQVIFGSLDWNVR